MRNLKKHICAVILVGILALGLVACAEESNPEESNVNKEDTDNLESSKDTDDRETITLKFFNGNVEMVDWYNEAIERFNAQNETIKVEHEFQKEGTSALQTKFAAGDIPDITTMGTQQMIDAEKFVDLTDSEWWNRIDPSVKEISADVKSGNNYYLPTNTMITATIYNQKIFDELNLESADTLDEFTENLRKIKAAYPEKDPLYFSGKEAWTMGMLFGYIPDAVQRQRLGELEFSRAALEGDLSKLQFAENEGVLEKYVAWLGVLQDEGLINSNVLTATYDDAMNAIATGEATIIFQGMFTLSNILSINPDAENELRVGAFPAVVSDVKPALNQGPDSTYYILADSMYQEEAKVFLDWLFSVENQVSFTETRNAPSAFTDVSADIGSMAVFDIIMAITMGGPGYATESLSIYIYRQSFNGFAGYATAVAVIMFIIIVIPIAVSFRWMKGKEIEI